MQCSDGSKALISDGTNYKQKLLETIYLKSYLNIHSISVSSSETKKYDTSFKTTDKTRI